MRKRLSRSETREANRRRLLEAAERVVTDRGFGAASVEEIVKAAGLTSGALYSNFEGRDALLVEVLAERQRRQPKPGGSVEGATLRERLESLGRAFAANPESGSLAGSIDLLLFALRCPAARELVAAKLRSGLRDMDALLGESDDQLSIDQDELSIVVVAYFLGLVQLRAVLGEEQIHGDLFGRIASMVARPIPVAT